MPNQSKNRSLADRIMITTDIKLNISFGVYAIKCLVNNAVYIGGTTKNFDKRLREHVTALERNEHPNRLLRKDWQYFTSAAFTFSVLQTCDQPEEVTLCEQHWIQKTVGSIFSHHESYNPEIRKEFLQRRLDYIVALYHSKSPDCDLEFLLSVIIRLSPEVSIQQCARALDVYPYTINSLFYDLHKNIWYNNS